MKRTIEEIIAFQSTPLREGRQCRIDTSNLSALNPVFRDINNYIGVYKALFKK